MGIKKITGGFNDTLDKTVERISKGADRSGKSFRNQHREVKM